MLANGRTSSYSTGNGACVDVGSDSQRVGVRDSTLQDASPIIMFDADVWSAFIAGVKAIV